MSTNELKVGDIVTYSFVTRQGELCAAIIEILELKLQEHDKRPIAKVKFHKSLSDNTGNNYFDYLARIGGSMWASQECLHKDTEVPNG